MDTLPRELYPNIFLDIKSMLVLSQTSSMWCITITNELTNNQYWSKFLFDEYETTCDKPKELSMLLHKPQWWNMEEIIPFTKNVFDSNKLTMFLNQVMNGLDGDLHVENAALHEAMLSESDLFPPRNVKNSICGAVNYTESPRVFFDHVQLCGKHNIRIYEQHENAVTLYVNLKDEDQCYSNELIKHVGGSKRMMQFLEREHVCKNKQAGVLIAENISTVDKYQLKHYTKLVPDLVYACMEKNITIPSAVVETLYGEKLQTHLQALKDYPNIQFDINTAQHLSYLSPLFSFKGFPDNLLSKGLFDKINVDLHTTCMLIENGKVEQCGKLFPFLLKLMNTSFTQHKVMEAINNSPYTKEEKLRIYEGFFKRLVLSPEALKLYIEYTEIDSTTYTINCLQKKMPPNYYYTHHFDFFSTDTVNNIVPKSADLLCNYIIYGENKTLPSRKQRAKAIGLIGHCVRESKADALAKLK